MTKDRAYRGGSWDDDADYYRAANRIYGDPDNRFSGIGFRCATGERGSDRVLRGGSWDSGAASCRAALRFSRDPGCRGGNVGFRCWRKE